MASINPHRHQTIQLVIAQRPDAVVNTSIDLWERLASTLILSIGEIGFQSLFSRNIHATAKTFPWMILSHSIRAAESKFVELRTCLEGQGVEESSAASASLLNAFIDMLILLIGEQLSTNILSLAWGDRC